MERTADRPRSVHERTVSHHGGAEEQGGNPTLPHWGPWQVYPPRGKRHCSQSRFLKKLETELPLDPAIPLLGIHPEETRIEKDTCTPMFTAVSFTIVRTWKQPRCPLADEWRRKLLYIHTMEYYSAIKRDAFESVLMR